MTAMSGEDVPKRRGAGGIDTHDTGTAAVTTPPRHRHDHDVTKSTTSGIIIILCAGSECCSGNATLAQLAERLTRNEQVDSSILSSGSTGAVPDGDATGIPSPRPFFPAFLSSGIPSFLPGIQIVGLHHSVVFIIRLPHAFLAKPPSTIGCVYWLRSIAIA